MDMKALDPTKMKDWEIAEAAEATLRPATELVAELGLQEDEWDPYGRVLAKVDATKERARPLPRSASCRGLAASARR